MSDNISKAQAADAVPIDSQPSILKNHDDHDNTESAALPGLEDAVYRFPLDEGASSDAVLSADCDALPIDAAATIQDAREASSPTDSDSSSDEGSTSDSNSESGSDSESESVSSKKRVRKTKRRSKNGSKRRSKKGKGNVRWTTEAEIVFLTERVPAYEGAQRNQTQKSFFDDLRKAYFAKFPPLDNNQYAYRKKVSSIFQGSEQILTYFQQLKWWFSNHTGARGEKGKVLSKAATAQIASLFKVKPLKTKGKKTGGSRLKQPAHAYSDLYYYKWKHEIRQMWREHKKANNLTYATKRIENTPKMQFRNKEMLARYNGETPEVKNEVEQYRQELKRTALLEDDSRFVRPDEINLPSEERRRREAARKKQ